MWRIPERKPSKNVCATTVYFSASDGDDTFVWLSFCLIACGTHKVTLFRVDSSSGDSSSTSSSSNSSFGVSATRHRPRTIQEMWQNEKAYSTKRQTSAWRCNFFFFSSFPFSLLSQRVVVILFIVAVVFRIQNILFYFRSSLSFSHSLCLCTKIENKINHWIHIQTGSIVCRRTRAPATQRCMCKIERARAYVCVYVAESVVCMICMRANWRCDKVQRTSPSVSFRSYLWVSFSDSTLSSFGFLLSLLRLLSIHSIKQTHNFWINDR